MVVIGALGLAGCGDDGRGPVVTSAASDDTGKTQGEVRGEDQTVGSTREDPFPIGSTVEGTQWAVTINSVNLDADDVVAAADRSNPAAPDGTQYALVNITAAHTGTDAATPAFTIRYVSADGTASTAYDPTVVVPGAFDSSAAVSQGAATGNLLLIVPTDAPETGVLSVEPERAGATSYVAVQ